MTIQNELLDQLPGDYKKPQDIIGENGLLKQLTKALVEPRWRRDGASVPLANALPSYRYSASPKTSASNTSKLAPSRQASG